MLLALLAPVTGVAQQQQTTATTITLQSTFDPNACFGWDAHGGDVTLTLATFTDPLPPASLLRSASITWPLGNDKEFSFQLIPAVTLFINGTQLGPQQVIGNYNGCIPGASIPYVFPSDDYPQGFPGYVYGGLNTATFDLQAGNIHPTGPAVLTLTYVPPNPFEFNVTDQASEADRRIILSNERSGYGYPTFQGIGGQDSQVPMFLRARGRDGQYQAGLTVYLRVDDPPDTAAYTNLSQNVLSHKGDNVGPVAQLEGVTPVPNLSGVYQGTSTTNGELDFVLALQTGTASGDNYQVEASFDPSFPAGATTKSGTLTAWKRIFVEKHRMLQNGVRLSADASAGATTIQVFGNHYNGNQGKSTIKAGDRIIIVHSPALNRLDGFNGWYYEIHDVADVKPATATDYTVTLGTSKGKTITTQPLLHPFTIERGDITVGDSIAKLSGTTLTSADYFDTSDELLAQYDASGTPTSAFPQAFVEYIVIPDSELPGGFVPIPHVLSGDDVVLQDLADRWSTSVAAGGTPTPDYQLLIIGDADTMISKQNPPTQVGLTTHMVGGQVSSFVFRGAINFAVHDTGVHHNQDPNNWAAKNEAHELTHQWTVDAPWLGINGADLGHCPSNSTVFDDSTVYCLEATTSDTMSETQSDNLIAKLHLLQLPGTTTWHSEYFEIRTHADPFVP